MTDVATTDETHSAPPAHCAGSTKHGTPCRALAGPSGYCGNHAPHDQLQQLHALVAKSLGGQVAKATPTIEGADALDLGSSEGRQRVLEAVARAVALGRCSAPVGKTLAQLVKTAADDATRTLEALVEQLSAKLEELASELEMLRARR
jgi:hypothetical protein